MSVDEFRSLEYSTAAVEGKTVLVTGGSGFIGSHVVVELLEKNANVIIVDNLVNSSEKVLERIHTITGKKPTFRKVDLCDLDAIDAVFKEFKNVDMVIHFAALKAVGESTLKPLQYYRNNLMSTINLLQVMAEHNCFRLVFSSSATVYGEKGESPFSEDRPTGNVTNPYGRTKLFIEDICRDVAKTDRRWRIALLRYFNPVGAHKSGLIGEDPRGIPNNLLPYLAQVAVGARPFLSVFGNDYPTVDGTGVRDYIHVVDLARGHMAALTRGVITQSDVPESTVGGVCEAYNLGTGKGNSVLEVIGYMEKACGHKIEYRIAGRRPGDVPCMYADASKAAKELHWTTIFGIEEAVKDHWNWQSKNPKGYDS